jgi:hypothetical protein
MNSSLCLKIYFSQGLYSLAQVLGHFRLRIANQVARGLAGLDKFVFH